MRNFLRFAGVLAVAATSVQAETTCLLQQPRARGASYQSSTITYALLEVVSTSQGICSRGFPPLPDGSKGSVTRRSNGSLVLVATRHNNTVHLGAACVKAFSSIIHTCIGQALYWGGNSTADEVDYAIFNEEYPKNWIPEPSPEPPRRSSSSKLNTQKPKPLPSSEWSINSPKSLHTPTRDVLPSDPFKRTNVRTQGSSAHTIKPASTTSSASFRTQILAGVTGVPGSFSQTKTTGSNGLATNLPVWFGAGGVAILVAPLIAGVGLVPPPPVGLPPVEIGPDGVASRVSQPQDHTPTHSPSTQNNRPSPSPTSHTSSSSSGASSRKSTTASTATLTVTAGLSSYIITPKDVHDSAATSALNAALQETFGPQLVFINDIDIGVVFWGAAMTQSQINYYKAHSEVIRRGRYRFIYLMLTYIGLGCGTR